MLPASNMKLITTAAAVSKLGPGFVFRTELRRIDPADWPDQAVAAGAASTPAKETVLMIHGDGDPGLADPELLKARDMDVEQFLQAWVKAVKDAGIQHVERLVVDDRVFDRQYVHPTWPREQLSEWFCAEVGGINFYDNCIDVYAEPATTRGQGARVRLIPATPFMTTVNRAITGSLDRFVVNRRPGSNELIFSGEVKTRQTHGVNVTIDNPPMFFGGVLASRLADAGISWVKSFSRTWRNRSRRARRSSPTKTRCRRSWRGATRIRKICSPSRSSSGWAGRSPGCSAVGTTALRRYGCSWRTSLAGGGGGERVTDGSGMQPGQPRPRRASSSGCSGRWCTNPACWPIYRDSLSMDHSDGSLKLRFRALSPKLASTLYPKTGYIRGVCTLSGYMVSSSPGGSKHAVVLSLLFNDLKAPLSQIQELQDNIILLIDHHLSGKL